MLVHECYFLPLVHRPKRAVIGIGVSRRDQIPAGVEVLAEGGRGILPVRRRVGRKEDDHRHRGPRRW